jgi:hypothetical protein
MREMDRRVGFLRLLLADIADRERQANEAVSQLRAQLRRIVDYTVQHNGSVANALAGMAEIEEQLSQQEAALGHLALLRRRAQDELHALLVTRDVSEARARLSELEAQRARLLNGVAADTAPGDALPPSSLPALAQIDAEIAELRTAIQTASDAAARALTGGEFSQQSAHRQSER